MILLDFGGIIKGDSTIANHVGWITVSSISMGVSRNVSTSGSGKDRDTSTPSFSEITVTKTSDIASTQLFAQAIYGKKICDKAIVHLVQTGGEGGDQVYMVLELSEPIISTFSQSTGGDRPSESISINFTKIVMRYTQFESGGNTVDADPKGYDIKTGKPFTG